MKTAQDIKNSHTVTRYMPDELRTMLLMLFHKSFTVFSFFFTIGQNLIANLEKDLIWEVKIVT